MGDQWICCLLFQLLRYEYFILSKDPPWSHSKDQLLARGDSRGWNLTGKVTKPTRGEGVAKKVMDVTLQYVYINYFFFMSNFLSFLPGGALISLSATIKSY